MGLFRNESFISHAGLPLPFKIECDALTDEDLETLALIVARSHSFSKVIPVPRGGVRFAAALKKYRMPQGGILIVDDVFTTGMSMEAVLARTWGGDVQGVVLFARAPCPPWIKAIFQLTPWAGP